MTRRHKKSEETFWGRLCVAMRNKGMKATQEAAGALVGITQTGARKWAQGSLPSMEHAVILAEKLDVCVDWLLTGRGLRHPIYEKTWLGEIVSLYHLTDEDGQKELLKFARYRRTISFTGDPEARESLHRKLGEKAPEEAPHKPKNRPPASV